MTTVPILAILGGAVALGAVNLTLRLRGQRRPVLIGVHLLLGIGALEVLVFFLRDANGGEGVPAGPYGNVAAALLAIAVFIGLVSPIVAKNSRSLSNALLVAHVASGSLGEPSLRLQDRTRRASIGGFALGRSSGNIATKVASSRAISRL